MSRELHCTTLTYHDGDGYRTLHDVTVTIGDPRTARRIVCMSRELEVIPDPPEGDPGSEEEARSERWNLFVGHCLEYLETDGQSMLVRAVAAALQRGSSI